MRCVVNKRTGPDLLCDQCRTIDALRDVLKSVVAICQRAGIGPLPNPASLAGDDVVHRVQRLADAKAVAERQWKAFAEKAKPPCLFCGRAESEHGDPQPVLGRPDRFGRLCPVPGVTSQYYSPQR